ncbi:MAG: alpha-glucuronidase [Prevotella sp.]|nr:alpha-glucuronidase [Prevotella sp.]
MIRFLCLIIALTGCVLAHAEDGSQLWLHYDKVNACHVVTNRQSPTIDIAVHELTEYCKDKLVTLVVDDQLPLIEGGFTIKNDTITASSDIGLLYGAYELLRLQTTESPLLKKGIKSEPYYHVRLLNHWDNLDGSIERGYAGKSIFWADGKLGKQSVLDTERLVQYARANASIGINGTVLNNVNASPKILTKPYLQEVSRMANALRPYGIRVYLSINFASPMALKGTKTADPLDASVQHWWKKKVDEIYRLIPDFGGFLVKANSEGQPGPFDYNRTHADGANMLADALKPHGGIVMWRCFVYGSKHKGEDRVKQAVSEFLPLDGQFRDNVVLQTKNGPLDFQPREPYSPIFDQIKQTPNMVELQITQEYLGQSRHLVFLAPMWREFFHYVHPSKLRGIAGVSNIGDDTNWCGHHFSQANWYAFGRLAWNPFMRSESIAREWLQQTFFSDHKFLMAMQQLMIESREACVNYMMPLGLHHLFSFDHHYGPQPDSFRDDYPLEWCSVYYHQADSAGIGFDRSRTGSNATSQYAPPLNSIYDNVETCPEMYLLWFHRVPWDYRMNSGLTLWQELQEKYNSGVRDVERFCLIWDNMKPYFKDDMQRWNEVSVRLAHQLENAREWRDVCLTYFGTFANRKQKE